MSFTVFVGHVVSEIDEIKFGSRDLVDQNGTEFGRLIEGALLYIRTKIGEHWPGGPMGRQITEGCKKFVTLFSYIAWSSAMKFGSVRGLANRHLFPEFGELRSWVPAIPCGDMHQFFTDTLVIIIRSHRSTTYVDAAYCYRPSIVVCRSVYYSSEICKNSRTNRDAVWVEDSSGPKANHVLDGNQHPPWEGAI